MSLSYLSGHSLHSAVKQTLKLTLPDSKLRKVNYVYIILSTSTAKVNTKLIAMIAILEVQCYDIPISA